MASYLVVILCFFLGNLERESESVLPSYVPGLRTNEQLSRIHFPFSFREGIKSALTLLILIIDLISDHIFFYIISIT